LDKVFNPAEIESRHYSRWEQSGYFAAHGEQNPYCIVIPPPNVTGTLHMGHAFQVTIMDAYTRYHRMRGDATLWQPGTDHAGIATQMVVERLLDAEGTDRRTLGREKFLERVWEWKERSGNTITQQLRRLGASVDWSRERFTMDPGLSAAVIEVFVRLYDEGLIYRGKRLVNWDPVLHTALSDLEVLSAEESGHLWRLRYPLTDSDECLVVATTRPETMLGDAAVAVHPDDERYRHLVGRSIDLPLTDRRIPVIADEYVDPEFGTGCVKITPAHDFNDYEIGLRHKLEQINVFDENAALNEAAPQQYRGLDRFDARKRMVADLEALGLVDGIDDHKAMIPRGDRSGVVVEPLLTDQWYVRAEPLARPAVEAVRTGRVRFVPKHWEKWYYEWMNNIQDWCISRQLWWGHRIPAWYDEAGNVYVGRNEQEVRKKHDLDCPLRQDEDVLDTWFSSALWPFTTLGWPEQTPELERFYPTALLVTGFDIIFFWVARMIMMGLKFMGDVPFREVYFTGLIRDYEGQKMSKAKGNILDPIDIIDGIDLDTLLAKRTDGLMQTHLRARIEQATKKEFPNGIAGYGTDALRFTLASIATNARDLNLDIARVEGYQRFCTKLWNAARFVIAQHSDAIGVAADPGIFDKWIRSELKKTIETVDRNFAAHRMDLVAQALYDFVWHEFCDWYLELSKGSIAQPAGQRQAAIDTLADVLGAVLRLLHPLMPYITEELWLALCAVRGNQSESIMIERLPAPADYAADAAAQADVHWLKTLIVAVRQMRGEMNVKPSQQLRAVIANASDTDKRLLEDLSDSVARLAGVNDIEHVASDTEVPESVTVMVGDMRIMIPLAGIIDVTGEVSRLEKLYSKNSADISTLSRKLDNPGFIAKAPAHVVARDRERLSELQQQNTSIEDQLSVLRRL
jgi:valyl-tRNA synthetase